MKLSSVSKINSNIKPTNNNHYSNKKPANVNFTGIESVLDGMVKFWQTIDNGGRALQFTCEDMFGTNFPRSYKGLTAGKKYTGKYNWTAFFQEAIREFLTGPTMTFFPIAALAFSKHKFGPSANTKNINMNGLSNLMDGVSSGTQEEVKNQYFTKVAKDMLNKTLDSSKDNKSNIESESKTLAHALKEYSSAFDDTLKLAKEKKGADRVAKETLKERQKILKGNLKEKEEALTKTFTDIIRKNKADYSNTNFQIAKHTVGTSGTRTGVTNFKNYCEYVASYMHDFLKANTSKDNIVNTSTQAIQNFKNCWTGKRLFTMFNMIIITGMLMRQIPSLYTKASGRINPNASSIYNEADNRRRGIKPRETKPEVNNDK